MPKEELYDVLYDWDPENDDDLRLVAGETLTVLEKNDHGWWYGIRTKSDGTLRKGFFPKNYVKKKTIQEPPKPPPRPTSSMENRLLPQTPNVPSPQIQSTKRKDPDAKMRLPKSSIKETRSQKTSKDDDRVTGKSLFSKHVESFVEPSITNSKVKIERNTSGSEKLATKQVRLGLHCLRSIKAFNELVTQGYTVEVDDTSLTQSALGKLSRSDSVSSNSSGAVSSGSDVRKGMKVKLKCAAMIWDAAFTTTKEFANGMVNFIVGSGQVTQGMEAAVQSLCVGQRAMITCGPSMAYGSAGNPPSVPPNTHVIFRVEVVSATAATSYESTALRSSGNATPIYNEAEMMNRASCDNEGINGSKFGSGRSSKTSGSAVVTEDNEQEINRTHGTLRRNGSESEMNYSRQRSAQHQGRLPIRSRQSDEIGSPHATASMGRSALGKSSSGLTKGVLKSRTSQSPTGRSADYGSYSSTTEGIGKHERRYPEDDYYSQSSQGESYSLSLNNDILDP